MAAALLAVVHGGCSGNDEENGNGNGGPDESDVGQPCPGDDPAQCASGVCLFGQDGQSYCSAYCGVTDTCPDDFPCQRVSFAGDQREICAPACEQDGGCQSGTCEVESGQCAPPPEGDRPLGESCGPDDGLCVFGLVCVTREGVSRCIDTCTPESTAFCPDGTLCFHAFVPESGICWLGGETGAEGTCDSDLDCVAGHVCVSHLGDPACRPACDPEGGSPECAEGTSCHALDDGRIGVCLS